MTTEPQSSSLNRIKEIIDSAGLIISNEYRKNSGKYEIVIPYRYLTLPLMHSIINTLSKHCKTLDELTFILDNMKITETYIIIQNLVRIITMEDIYDIETGNSNATHNGIPPLDVKNFLFDSAGQLHDEPYDWLSIQLNKRKYDFDCHMVKLYYRAFYARGNQFIPRRPNPTLREG